MKTNEIITDFAWSLLIVAGVAMGGCDFLKTDKTRLFSPDRVINSAKVERSPINPILPSVGVVDTTQELVPNATFPADGDWSYSEADYITGPSDILDISILDLLQEGIETILRRQVSESGYIDLPLLEENIKVGGLTRDQIKQLIIDAYSPDILRDPTVSVTIAGQRQSTFSILGAVARPNTYTLVRKDLRLLEAMAMSGGMTQASIRYIYVIRPKPATSLAKSHPQREPKVPEPLQLPPLPEIPDQAPPSGEPKADQPATIEPKADSAGVESALQELFQAMPGAPPASQPAELPAPAVLPRLSEMATTLGAIPTTTADHELKTASKTYKWVYTNGRWIRVAQEAQVAKKPSGEGAPPVRPAGLKPKTAPVRRVEDNSDPFGWKKVDKSDLARIIAINVSKLRNGDPRMNIVIRTNDIIQVPFLERGEFYVMGAVFRPGVYDLTGRRVTVKQALAAAGNLGPLAWPENSILIRRIGNNQEQIVPLKIEAIFRGEEPDVFIKNNDIIAVGTDVRASFYAVIRNAFRLTYGFGFIYDRNFADPYEFLPLDSKRFSRW